MRSELKLDLKTISEIDRVCILKTSWKWAVTFETSWESKKYPGDTRILHVRGGRMLDVDSRDAGVGIINFLEEVLHDLFEIIRNDPEVLVYQRIYQKKIAKKVAKQQPRTKA